MDHIERMMFDLLRFEMAGTAVPQEISPGDVPKLYTLAKKHELVHLLADALSKLGISAITSLGPMLDAHLFDAYYRYERYQHAFDQITCAFEAAQIPHIPLKGLMLRSLYPEPWMRTSCDMDILVHPEDLDRAGRILTDTLEYQFRMRTRHDVSYLSSDGVCVELHHDLLEENRAVFSRTVLSSVWNRSQPVSPGLFRQVLPDDLFYFYHIAHMAKHFETGGCGIRTVLDLWLMEQAQHYWNPSTIALLKEGGLYPFANAVRKLASVWFNGEEPNSLLLQVEEYILHGGIYGSANHRYAVYHHRSGGRWRYLLSRVFLSRDALECQYPILHTHHWLFPFCQIARWWALLCGKKTDSRKKTVRNIQQTTNEQVHRIADLLDMLEL